MSRNRLELQGLTELRTALRQLPAELVQEASAIVLAHAEQAQRDIRDGYPTGPTGNLKRGVTVIRTTSRVTTAAIVRSRAPHAYIYEHGTTTRRTDRGANRGRMPEAPVERRMIPKVIRLRRRMVDQLIALVRRAGFTVDA